MFIQQNGQQRSIDFIGAHADQHRASWLRIADALLVGLPFEITVESGRRMARAVHAELGDASPIDDVVICSLVNEYWGYVATEEEYGRQFYEGGHTLYGPATQAFLASKDLVARIKAEAPR